MQTYEEIYEEMKANYKQETGTDISDASDIGIRFSLLSGEIYSLLCQCNWLKNQMFADTATGECLDLHAKQRDITRKTATYASGMVLLSVVNSPTTAINVPVGAIISAGYKNPVSFKTTQAVSIVPGIKIAAVPVMAIHPGKAGNVAKDVQFTKVSGLSLIDSITNSAAFTGGADDESDEELRKRITDSYKNSSNGTNAAFYKQLALSVDGVASAGVIPRNRGIGTVDVFLAAQNGTVSQEIADKVDRLLCEQREINVDVHAYPATQISLGMRVYVIVDELADFNLIETQCEKAITDFINNSPIGQDILTSDIIILLRQIEGVINATISTGYSSISVAENQKPVAGAVVAVVTTEE